jgi:hypothetical protein
VLSFRNYFSPTTLRLEFGLVEAVRRFETTENYKPRRFHTKNESSISATRSTSQGDGEGDLITFANIEKAFKPSRLVSFRKKEERDNPEKSISMQQTVTVSYLSSFNI